MKNLLFLGDIHGNFNYVKWYINEYKLKNCIIYQVGDFGIGFTTEYNDMVILGDLNNFLKERDIQIYVIRGNHDNPKFFDGHLANHFENLHLLADYTVIDVEGIKILGIGGAISIDRKPRLRDMQKAARYGCKKELYWHDEVFVLDEEKLKTFENIDIVVTHTAPDFCVPNNKNGFADLVYHFAENDTNLIQDLIEERMKLTKMYEIIKEKNKPFLHIYGHFHIDHYDNFDDCEFRVLGINEFYDPRINYTKDLNEKYGK